MAESCFADCRLSGNSKRGNLAFKRFCFPAPIWLSSAKPPYNDQIPVCNKTSFSRAVQPSPESHRKLTNASRKPNPHRLILLFALCLSIPAFYLLLSGTTDPLRRAGALLYLAMAALIALDAVLCMRHIRHHRPRLQMMVTDAIIFLGALASAGPRRCRGASSNGVSG